MNANRFYHAITLILVSVFLQACDGPELDSANKDQSGSDQSQALATQPSPPPATGAEIIATGAKISGANGIHFGPDGLLYVASVLGSEIIILDPTTGEVKNRLGADKGVIGPDDLAFAPDGSYYWTSILTGEVAGFNPQGEKVVAAMLTPGVNPITFSDDGRLFVSQCFFDYKLFEVDPKGVKVPRLMNDNLGPHCGLNGMDWGPDNRLYGPRWFDGEVVSFNVDDNTMRKEASGFMTPAAVKFNSKGELHVLDTGKGQVIRVQGSVHEVIATFDPGLDNFAFDANDQLYVSSFVDGYVKKLNTDGSITELSPGGMAHPGGITFWNNQLVVADLHSIRGYNPDTGKSTFTQRNILGVGKMGGAVNITADGDNLILVSWVDNDVRVWDQTRQTLIEKHANLGSPVSAVRYAGRLIVTEHANKRVIAIGSGEPEVIARDLPAPTGLYIHGDKLYLSDRSRGEILLIADKGIPLVEPQILVSGLTTPEGFVVTDAAIFVVEADWGQISKIDKEGNKTLLGRIPPGTQASSAGQPPSMLFGGLTLSDDGTLFTTGETNRSLYRIKF